MNILSDIDSWESVRLKAYGERDFSQEFWRKHVSEGDPFYLTPAVKFLHIKEFVHFYGKEQFALHWPFFRSMLHDDVVKHVAMYDLVWSRLVSKSWNLRPYRDFYFLSEYYQRILIAIAKMPGKNMEELALAMNMNLVDVEMHANSLICDGRVAMREVSEDGHCEIKLYPSYKSPL